MSAFAASAWASVASVAHQLERDATSLDPPVARTLRGFARRLHAARLLARHLIQAMDPNIPSSASHAPSAAPTSHP